MEDTITAISTALGVGAISIIRVSGPDSINIVNKIFKGKDLTQSKTHTIHYGKIIENNEEIDEVLVSIMKAPKTFTKENIVEINCHGGIMTTNRVLEILLKNGCRMAEPGEFTKRAYLNGRINLQEAEGIMDLINAKTENQRKMAMNQVNGNLSNKIKEVRNEIVKIISNIEVNIDYPEYDDVEVITIPMVKNLISNLEPKIKELIKNSESGKLIKEGINVAIIGKPNVGKSSLLNTLLEENKAIVTDIEGTTRDIVEGQINLDGIILNIIDTAGIRETNNIVEQIGVEKSKKIIDTVDLVLFILNNNEEISDEEINLMKEIENKNHIILINKIDLENKLHLENDNVIKISTKTNTGIDELKNKIKEIFNLEQIETKDLTYISNSREIAILKNILTELEEIKNNIDSYPIDILEIDIKNIWNEFGNIIGEIDDSELIDYMFKNFCLGK